MRVPPAYCKVFGKQTRIGLQDRTISLQYGSETAQCLAKMEDSGSSLALRSPFP